MRPRWIAAWWLTFVLPTVALTQEFAVREWGFPSLPLPYGKQAIAAAMILCVALIAACEWSLTRKLLAVLVTVPLFLVQWFSISILLLVVERPPY